jgi:hypothetical protein
MRKATIFGLKIFKFFVADPLGPKSSAISTLDPGEIRTRVKNSGSATLDKERHKFIYMTSMCKPVLRIQDVNPGSWILDPGSIRFRILDLDPRQRI